VASLVHGRTNRNLFENLLGSRDNQRPFNAEFSSNREKLSALLDSYMLIVELIGSALFDQFIIEAENQDGRRPLSHKKSLVMAI
jgi:hypothetical protein